MADVSVDPAVRDYLQTAGNGAAPSIFPELDMAAQFVNARTAHKRNGADYILIFEVPLYFATPINMMPDGLSLRFTVGDGEIIEIGDGGYLKSTATSRDPDGGRHLKATFQLPASALDSMGAMSILQKQNRTEGRLRLEATQGTFDLTAKA